MNGGPQLTIDIGLEEFENEKRTWYIATKEGSPPIMARIVIGAHVRVALMDGFGVNVSLSGAPVRCDGWALTLYRAGKGAFGVC